MSPEPHAAGWKAQTEDNPKKCQWSKNKTIKLLQSCIHANNVWTVECHRLMRVTDVGKNHLVYQFQLILCLQRVVTKRVTTLEEVGKNTEQ